MKLKMLVICEQNNLLKLFYHRYNLHKIVNNIDTILMRIFFQIAGELQVPNYNHKQNKEQKTGPVEQFL